MKGVIVIHKGLVCGLAESHEADVAISSYHKQSPDSIVQKHRRSHDEHSHAHEFVKLKGGSVSLRAPCLVSVLTIVSEADGFLGCTTSRGPAAFLAIYLDNSCCCTRPASH